MPMVQKNYTAHERGLDDYVSVVRALLVRARVPMVAMLGPKSKLCTKVTWAAPWNFLKAII